MNLNGRTTNPGELRTRVSLQRRVTTINASGFPVPDWEEVASAWARWINLHGSEAWTAESQGIQEGATVLLRYRADIDESWVVVKGGKRFEIISLDNIQERGEYIELKVKRMAPA